MREGRGSSEEEDSATPPAPGEGWEPTLSVQLGPPQEIQVGDTAGDDDLSRVTRSQFWV